MIIVFLFLPWVLAGVLAAAISAALIWAIRPMLRRYALARPNARSSHRVPTPQGAGIAVIAATLAAAGFMIAGIRSSGDSKRRRGVRRHGFPGFGRPGRRRQVDPGVAAAGPAGGGRRPRRLPRTRGAATGAGMAALDRARTAAAGRPLVRQPGQLHGRAGLDDGRRSGAGHRRFCLHRRSLQPRFLRYRCCRSPLWRDDRLCAVQPAGGVDLPRRRRQLADRLVAWLVPASPRLSGASRGRAAAADVLSVRRDFHTVTTDRPQRTVLGGASFAFLSARHRQWLFRVERGGHGCSAQHRTRGVGDRIGRDAVIHALGVASLRRWRGDRRCHVPLFATRP